MFVSSQHALATFAPTTGCRSSRQLRARVASELLHVELPENMGLFGKTYLDRSRGFGPEAHT